MPRLTSRDLGGWLLKCNPKVSDPGELLARGVDSWCVRPSYRTDLIGPGQHVFFWVTGPTGGRPVPGLWATGYTTGPAKLGPAGKLVMPVELEFLPEPVPRELVAVQPELATMEVLRQPAMSNPSWVDHGAQVALRQLAGRPTQPDRSTFPY